MTEFSRPVLAYVDGWGINTPNLEVALRAILTAASAARPMTVFTLNLDHLVKLRESESFREAYRNADVVTADGVPVVRLARRQNIFVERTTGADMLVPLVKAAALAGLPIFLFGSTHEILKKSEEKLRRLTGGVVNIVGTLAPSANFDPTGTEADQALEMIKASGARICLVALGAPKQEIFANNARKSGLNCTMICNGAALDFLVGAQTRAPKLLGNMGFEWAWRLALNPRRFAKRYFDSAVILADIVLLRRSHERYDPSRLVRSR